MTPYNKELERQKVKSLVEAGGYADQLLATRRWLVGRGLRWVLLLAIGVLIGVAIGL